MKKLLLVIFLAALAALGIWFGTHGGSSRTTSAAITVLLPKETLAFLHVPDVNGSRKRWHETDLYKLWREPAVQEFLQRPLSQVPKVDNARARFQEMEQLEIRDAFIALIAWENERSKVVAGFRFKGSADDAEKVIGRWRAHLQQNPSSAKRETVQHENHRLEVTTEGAVTLATVYAGNSFLAANDLDALKALLDRLDGRVKDGGNTLTTDEEFVAGSRHMPATYAARGYARLDRYFEKLAARLPPEDPQSEQLSALRRLRSISGALSFDKGKMRDVVYVGMPKGEGADTLTRSSLALASREAFLYFASLISLPSQLPPQNITGATVPVPARRVLDEIQASGVTAEMWNAAFGSELGFIGEWANNSRVPLLFGTLPVKDPAKAEEVIAKITSAEGSEWTKTESGGVQFYTQPPVNPMLPLTPTMALSKERLILGHDLAAVESLARRSTSELAGTDNFHTAERLVPTATGAFAYFDTAAFYTRLDAAIRPMLVMAAAFMPGISQTVDLGKLPHPEVITKHLSPIVMSQRSVDTGYVTESAGPISFFQAGGAIGLGTGLGASLFRSQIPSFPGPGGTGGGVPQASPHPTESPDE